MILGRWVDVCQIGLVMFRLTGRRVRGTANTSPMSPRLFDRLEKSPASAASPEGAWKQDRWLQGSRKNVQAGDWIPASKFVKSKGIRIHYFTTKGCDQVGCYRSLAGTAFKL